MKQKRAIQLKAVIEGALLLDEKKRLEKQRDILKDCGLDKEAYNIQQKINECVMMQKKAKDKAKQQRLMLVKEMLLCFAAADFATECSDKVAEVFDKVTYGEEKSNGHDFAKLFRMQAEQLNQCVQLVDGQCGDERVSYLYADMAEEVVNELMPIAYKIIGKWMNSEQGKRIL